MTEESGKGLAQLWPSKKGSYTRRANGTLIRGLCNDLEALASRPDTTLPLPSDPFPIVISLTSNVHPTLLVDSSASKSLLKTCARKLTLKKFFEEEDSLPGDTVIHYLTSPGFPSVLKAEERALNTGTSYLTILICSPDFLIDPLSNPQFPNLYRHLEVRITVVSPTLGATSATLCPPVLDLIRDHLRGSSDRLLDVRISPTRDRDAKSSLDWTTIDVPSIRKRARVLTLRLMWRGYKHVPEIIDIHLEVFCDELVGIVTRPQTIDYNEALPKCVIIIQSDATDIRVASEWSNSTVYQGSAIENEDEVRRVAVGGAIERYRANVVDSEPAVIDSYGGLLSSGRIPVPPEGFILLSSEQYTQAGFRFTSFTPHTRTPRIPARSFTHQRDDFVPLSMAYASYSQKGMAHGEPSSSLPRIIPIPYAGTATGHDFEGALLSGLEEIIERDAVMIWWYSKLATDPMSIESFKVTETVGRSLAKGFDLSFSILPNELHISVVAAILHNNHHRARNIGFSCHPGTGAVTPKTITEAVALFDRATDLPDPAGRIFSATERLELSPNMALPYRQDRVYLGTIEWNHDSVHDLMIQQQLSLGPRAYEHRSPHPDCPIVPTI